MAMEIFKLMGTIAITKDKALQDIKAVQDQAQKTSTEMGKSFEKAGKYITDHSATFRKMGIAMTVVGGVIALAVKNVGKAFDEYETKLVDMGKVTDESLEVIQDRIREIPPILGSATQLMAGYYQVISAGVTDTTEAMDLLTVGAKTAAAAHVEQSEVIKGLTKVLAGYKGEVKDATEAADLLYTIEKYGQTTVGELIPVIGGLALISAELNVSQQELAGSLALVSRTAGNTAEAATRYEALLIALIKPQEELTKAIEKMGYTSAQEAIQSEGLVEVLKKMREYSDQYGISITDLLGRKESAMAYLALEEDGFKKLSEIIVDVTGDVGGMEKAYEKWTRTGEAMNKLTANLTQNLKIMIGEVLDPMMDTLQRRLNEVLTGITAWVKANPELAGTIAKITAVVGGVLLVLGPLTMMLPSLVTGVTLLAGVLPGLAAAFLPFAVYAAIVIGFKKLAEYIKETREEAYKLKMGLAEITLLELDKEIEEIVKEINSLEKSMKEIDWEAEDATLLTVKYREMEAQVFELTRRLGILYETRKELTKTEKEGLELTEEEIAAREKLDDQIKEYEDSIKGLTGDVIELLKGSEKLSGQMKILTAEYELTNQTLEDTSKYYQGMLELSEALVKELEIEKEKTKEGTIERQEAILALLAAQKGVKDLTEAITELIRVEKLELEGLDLIAAKMSILEEQYRETEKDADYYGRRLKLLREEHKLLVDNLDAVIKKYGEGTDEYYKALTAIIANENEMKRWWKEIDKGAITVDEFATSFADKMLMMKVAAENLGVTLIEVPKTAWEVWKEFFDNLKEKYGTTLTILQDGISGFVSSFEGSISSAITSLLTMSETNAKIKEDMAKENESYTTEMAKLQEEYNAAVIAGDNEAAQNALDKMDDIKEKHEETVESMKDDMVTLGSIAKTFWNDLKTAAIKALAEIIAKQAISALLSMGWAGWLLLGIAFIASLVSQGKALGGEVAKQVKTLGSEFAYDLGGLIKGFQLGGGTDSVLIRATPGEYVVSKPMTDFIKRTGIVTSDLINAIKMGTKTPTPSFAVGGAVPSVISNPISNQVNIEEISVSIFAQTLNDETIANAGGKIFVELKRQLDMRGLVLMEG